MGETGGIAALSRPPGRGADLAAPRLRGGTPTAIDRRGGPAGPGPTQRSMSRMCLVVAGPAGGISCRES
jgi:hypothetical protein